MPRLAKGFLIGLAAVLALVAIGTLAMNLYVQSAGTQARIARVISDSLGTEVRMARTTVTPWSGLKITGITVPQPDGGGDFLEATDFAAFFEIFPLLHRQLIVDEITIDQPKVVWVQNSAGTWRMPSEPREPKEPGEPEKPKPEFAPIETAAPVHEARFSVKVKHLRIRGGSFDFYDAKGHRVVAFSDVDVDSPAISPGSAEGTATVGSGSVREELFFQNLRAPFRFIAGTLTLEKVTAQIAGGNLGGDLTVHTSEKHTPFTIDVNFDKVDVNKVIIQSGGMADQVKGALSGSLDLYGAAGDKGSVTGSGRVALAGGEVQYNFFQLLGQALQIGDLVRMDLRQAQANFRVGGKQVQVDDVQLRAQNLQLAAKGTVDFDGGLHLDSRLTINEKISRQLPAFIESNFQPGEEETRSLDFTVNGTVGRPRTDLLDRILGRKIQKEFGSLLQGLFGKHSSDGKKKDKKENPPAPAATLTPSAPATAE